MDLARLRTQLGAHRSALDQLGIRRIRVFGSVARGEETCGSDVDLLADFDRAVDLFELSRAKYELEQILGCVVDLAVPSMIRPEIRAEVERDLRDAA